VREGARQAGVARNTSFRWRHRFLRLDKDTLKQKLTGMAQTAFPVGMITAEQCRAARALLKWTQGEFAEKADLALSTIKDFEAERRTPHAPNLAEIERVFAAAGIEITNGDAPGVRRHKLEAEA
jgi:DNA-binding XRE family transcriptional regulator